jgi:hypothetical protein
VGMNKAVVRLNEGMGWHVVIPVNRSASKM